MLVESPLDWTVDDRLSPDVHLRRIAPGNPSGGRLDRQIEDGSSIASTRAKVRTLRIAALFSVAYRASSVWVGCELVGVMAAHQPSIRDFSSIVRAMTPNI
jgi:hypothetical protein